MKRVILWLSGVFAACLCLWCCFYIHKRVNNYTNLRNDIKRQENEIALLNEQNALHKINIQSASETVNCFSSYITNFELLETSLLSEKSDAVNGWEEWRIEAVCTGSLDNIFSFIDSLESTSMFYDLDFTIENNSGNLCDLNIKLRFFTI